MKKLVRLLRGLAMVGVAIAFDANAITVNFDDQPGTGDCVNTSLISGGFIFDTGFFQCTYGPAEPPSEGASNGTNILVNAFPLHFARLGGGMFDLTSLDLGLSFFNANPTDTLQITGNLTGGGTISTVVTVSQNFTTFTPNFTGLSSVDIASFPSSVGAWYFAVDNIEYDFVPTTSVPEPLTLALVGLGLLGIGIGRKRAA